MVEANDATNQSIREARNSSTLYTPGASCESPAFIALTPSFVLASRENAVYTLGLITLLFIVFSFPPFFLPPLASSPFVSLFRKEQSATEYATRNYRPSWRPVSRWRTLSFQFRRLKPIDDRVVSFYFFHFYGASWKISSSRNGYGYSELEVDLIDRFLTSLGPDTLSARSANVSYYAQRVCSLKLLLSVITF